jgi:HD-GYP domain-containing protein (c-di-GMP phosphodiesterase class II)
LSNVIPIRPELDRRVTHNSEMARILAQHETGEVLDLILDKAIQSTNAEGGSIYFIQELRQDSFGGSLPRLHRVLRFYRSINLLLNSRNLHSEFIEIDSRSIAGFVAMSGEVVKINDCYKLPASSPFQFDETFDQREGYKTKSLLTVPIKSTQGKVIGVVQLINKRKNRKVKKPDIGTFSKQDLLLVEALASQTSIALENAKLSADIAKLFESFVQASVTAIEARDPSTSGHSDRVAALTVDLAKTVDNLSSGPFRHVQFTPQQIQEIRYASLLHDFGKIGVREPVLLKAKKLFPNELESIMLRLDTARSKNETRAWKMLVEELFKKENEFCMHPAHDHNGHQCHQMLLKTQNSLTTFNQHIEHIATKINEANESQVMDEDFDIQGLMKFISDLSKSAGQLILTEQETKTLSIARGTLSPEERKEIESHVSFTFQFLSQIAWTDVLANVPAIAHAHHEKLDGTGYPLGLKEEQIPIQARMMAISDIFDALTAMDRPYKKAVTPQRAIEILEKEANQGKLDVELLKVFVDAQIFHQVNTKNIRRIG